MIQANNLTKFLLYGMILGLLNGCATQSAENSTPTDGTAETAPEPVENPVIAEAELVLAEAIGKGAEWLVSEPDVSTLPVTLSQILEVARAQQLEGDIAMATALAEKVIKFANLGLRQSEEQQSAAPYYPQ